MQKKKPPQVQPDKFLWRNDKVPELKQNINMDIMKEGSDFEIKGDYTLIKLKDTLSRLPKSYDDRIAQQVTEQILLHRITKDNTEQENIRLMTRVHEINAGKIPPSAEIPQVTSIEYDKSQYLYMFDASDIMVHKIGRALKQSKLKKHILTGTLLQQADNPGKQIDLTTRDLIVDFRECKRKELTWYNERPMQDMHFRVLILDKENEKYPVAIYMDSRENAQKFIDFIRLNQNYDEYLTVTRMGAYLWQLERAEALFVNMINFLNNNGQRRAHATREFLKKVQDRIYGAERALPQNHGSTTSPDRTSMGGTTAQRLGRSRVEKPFNPLGQTQPQLQGYARGQRFPQREAQAMMDDFSVDEEDEPIELGNKPLAVKNLHIGSKESHQKKKLISNIRPKGFNGYSDNSLELSEHSDQDEERVEQNGNEEVQRTELKAIDPFEAILREQPYHKVDIIMTETNTHRSRDSLAMQDMEMKAAMEKLGPNRRYSFGNNYLPLSNINPADFLFPPKPTTTQVYMMQNGKQNQQLGNSSPSFAGTPSSRTINPPPSDGAQSFGRPTRIDPNSLPQGNEQGQEPPADNSPSSDLPPLPQFGRSLKPGASNAFTYSRTASPSANRPLTISPSPVPGSQPGATQPPRPPPSQQQPQRPPMSNAPQVPSAPAYPQISSSFNAMPPTSQVSYFIIYSHLTVPFSKQTRNTALSSAYILTPTLTPPYSIQLTLDSLLPSSPYNCIFTADGQGRITESTEFMIEIRELIENKGYNGRVEIGMVESRNLNVDGDYFRIKARAGGSAVLINSGRAGENDMKLWVDWIRLEDIEGHDQLRTDTASRANGYKVIKRRLIEGRGIRSYVQRTEQGETIVYYESSEYDEARRLCPPEIEFKDDIISRGIINSVKLELSLACRAILTKIGTTVFGPELMSQTTMNADELACMLAYSVCIGLPPRSRRALYDLNIAKALEAYYPMNFKEDMSVQTFLESLDTQFFHNDVVDFFNEDTLGLEISPWGKLILPGRLKDPKEIPSLIMSHVLAARITNLQISSLAFNKQKTKTPLYDVFLVERCKVPVAYGMEPSQALRLLTWIEYQGSYLSNPPVAREFAFSKPENVVTYLKYFLREVDRETFDLLTEQNVSLDTVFLPFIMSNFAILPSTSQVMLFWDLQAFFCLLLPPMASPKLPPSLLSWLSAFQLLQVWLIIDSMDNPSFHVPPNSSLPGLMNAITTAITYNLSLPMDQLLYSLTNFLFDTIGKSYLAEGFLREMAILERRGREGGWRVAEAIALTGAMLGIGGAQLTSGINLWEGEEWGRKLKRTANAGAPQASGEPIRGQTGLLLPAKGEKVEKSWSNKDLARGQAGGRRGNGVDVDEDDNVNGYNIAATSKKREDSKEPQQKKSGLLSQPSLAGIVSGTTGWVQKRDYQGEMKSNKSEDDQNMIKFEGWNVEEMLREIALEKVSKEKMESEGGQESRRKKLELLHYLSLNGVYDPFVEDYGEFNFDKIRINWAVEDVMPELEFFLKDERFFEELIAHVSGRKQQPELVTTFFKLFSRPTKQNTILEQKPLTSVTSFFISMMITTPESNTERKALILDLLHYLQGLLTPPPPPTLPGQPQPAIPPQHPNPENLLSLPLLTACLHAISGYTALPMPYSLLPPYSPYPSSPSHPPLLRMTLGSSLLLSDDHTSLGRRLWSLSMATCGRGNIQIRRELGDKGAILSGVGMGVSGDGVEARVAIRKNDGRVKVVRKQVGQKVPGLGKEDKGEVEIGGGVGEGGESRIQGVISDEEALTALDHLNCFYNYAMTFTGLDRLDNVRLPSQGKITIFVRMDVGEEYIGTLVMDLIKDMALLDIENFLTKPPHPLPPDYSLQNLEPPFFTEKYPQSLLLQPVFIFSLLLRTIMGQLIHPGSPAHQKLDHSFVRLHNPFPAAVAQGQGHSPAPPPTMPTLRPEHSILENGSQLRSLLQTGTIHLLATLTH
jgi:hypothetical protein